ncbi:MAG: hypothetical protein H3C50_05480 [Kiritimatiellae bacterium]|nr:hypothetical protein [Kiritimatiellia bacterium]MCO5067230.1 hypothetical protein [Kiritimatiellia bacterium]
MKRVLKHIILAWLLCSAGLALSGCATGMVSQSLISSCDEADPPVEKYHAAFAYKGDVVLEYTVQDRRDKTFRRFSDRYWATLHLNELADRSVRGDDSIHRNPLPDRQRDKMTPIPIVDIRNHVSPASDGYMKYDAIFAFLKQQSSETVPQVFVCMNSGTQLYVRYRDPESGKIETYTNDPYDVFIPGSRYPKLLLLYPFALVGDIVTFPLILFSPRWPM